MSALQIVSIGDGSALELNSENLASILVKVPDTHKVAVVSVVGAFRTGKSFLLNFFLRYLRSSKDDDDSEDSETWMTSEGSKLTEGNLNNSTTEDVPSFAWRGGQERQTTGIWMWSEPFFRKCGSEKIAILLMDTQGMFDNETSMSLTAQIFGLSTFVSSYQIYNVDKRLQEDNLQHLALFSEYGRLAVGQGSKVQKEIAKLVSEDSTGDDAPTDKKEAESASSSTANHKPFQRLQFLVRDWQNFDVDWEPGPGFGLDEKKTIFRTLRGNMDDYLNEVLKSRTISDLDSTRDQIHRCFDKIDLFLLPHPGTAVTKKTYNGDIENIDPFFKGLLNFYIRWVFDKEIQPKLINNRTITGKELQTFFEVYVKMFQSGEGKSFPKAMTMLEATAEANNRNAHYLSHQGYKSKMMEYAGDDSSFVKETILQDIHNGAEKTALALFDEMATIGSEASIASYREKLGNDIESDRSRFFSVNALRNPFKDLEMYLVPLAVAGAAWLISTLFDVVCTSDVCELAEDSFERLYMFMAFGVLLLALRNPFKDVILYTVPIAAAVGAWVAATFISMSCGSETCKKTENALRRVYLFIIVAILILVYKNFRGSFGHILTVLQTADLSKKND